MVFKLSKLAHRLARIRVVTAALMLAACVGDSITSIDAPRDLRSQDSSAPNKRSHYVSPHGSSRAAGTHDDPWDLASALEGSQPELQPGDTLWLLGGTYRGPFTATISGRSNAPIIVRQARGERAIIDGAGTSSPTFTVRGAYVWYWGFELTNSDPGRTTSSTSHDWRPNGLVNYASYTRFIGMIVHDAGVGFYTDPAATHVEVTDGIFYNNGWQGPDRGHGHGLYLKSNVGPLVARGNIVFQQFGYGIHAYTNANSGRLHNIRIEDNILFDNGTLSDNSTSPNILLGGEAAAADDVIRGNLSWLSEDEGVNVQLGYGEVANSDVTMVENYLVGGNPVLRIGHWAKVTFAGNQLAGAADLIALRERAPRGYDWIGTRYYRDPSSPAWVAADASYPWPQWRRATGLGETDVALSSPPSETHVFVRPHRYETGRATVVVYNWAGLSEVSVELGSVLEPGAKYEAYNVQALFGSPVRSGTAEGTRIRLPLGGVSPPTPVGGSARRAPRTGSMFDVFIVTTR